MSLGFDTYFGVNQYPTMGYMPNNPYYGRANNHLAHNAEGFEKEEKNDKHGLKALLGVTVAITLIGLGIKNRKLLRDPKALGTAIRTGAEGLYKTLEANVIKHGSPLRDKALKHYDDIKKGAQSFIDGFLKRTD